MNTYVIILQNKYDNIIVFKTTAEVSTKLYDTSYHPSEYLKNKMIKNTYLFNSYSREDIEKCVIRDILSEDNLITI